MKKIIPIISLILALAGFGATLTVLITLLTAEKETLAWLLFIFLPWVIGLAAAVTLLAGITFFFRKNRICLISFILNLNSVMFCVAGILIWQFGMQ